jgi:hypothetical protein
MEATLLMFFDGLRHLMGYRFLYPLEDIGEALIHQNTVWAIGLSTMD